MGIGPTALELIIDLRLAGELPGGSICEFGSQDFVPDGFDYSALHIAEPGSGREFWSSLSYRYECIDLDGRHDAQKLDLNGAEYYQVEGAPFDLVTNFGTTEHVFDQANCFRLIHNITRPGGTMLHAAPSSGYPYHGLYMYPRAFFEDLASQNDYQVLHLSERRGEVVAAFRRRGGQFIKTVQGQYRS